MSHFPSYRLKKVKALVIVFKHFYFLVTADMSDLRSRARTFKVIFYFAFKLNSESHEKRKFTGLIIPFIKLQPGDPNVALFIVMLELGPVRPINEIW